MLFFLSFASRAGYVVDRYEDFPSGTVAPAGGGGQAVTRVVLRPQVEYGASSPGRSTETELHERAHASCYLARSVATTIEIDLDPPESGSLGEGCPG
jgi:organic hydroperoxide reductase OsmC/OhrA